MAEPPSAPGTLPPDTDFPRGRFRARWAEEGGAGSVSSAAPGPARVVPASSCPTQALCPHAVSLRFTRLSASGPEPHSGCRPRDALVPRRGPSSDTGRGPVRLRPGGGRGPAVLLRAPQSGSELARIWELRGGGAWPPPPAESSSPQEQLWGGIPHRTHGAPGTPAGGRELPEVLPAPRCIVVALPTPSVRAGRVSRRCVQAERAGGACRRDGCSDARTGRVSRARHHRHWLCWSPPHPQHPPCLGTPPAWAPEPRGQGLGIGGRVRQARTGCPSPGPCFRR